jgi:uncharacterized membrane protein
LFITVHTTAHHWSLLRHVKPAHSPIHRFFKPDLNPILSRTRRFMLMAPFSSCFRLTIPPTRATRLVHLIHLHFITVITLCLKLRIVQPTPTPSPHNYVIPPILLLPILSLNPNILSAAFYLFIYLTILFYFSIFITIFLLACGAAWSSRRRDDE